MEEEERKVLKRVGTPEEWLELWEKAEYVFQKIALLYVLTDKKKKEGWVRRLLSKEVLLLVIEAADGFDGNVRDFDPPRIRYALYPSWREPTEEAVGFHQIAQKAFQILCLLVFKKEKEIPLWREWIEDKEVLEKLL